MNQKLAGQVIGWIIAFLIALWAHKARIAYVDQLIKEGKNPSEYVEPWNPY